MPSNGRDVQKYSCIFFLSAANSRRTPFAYLFYTVVRDAMLTQTLVSHLFCIQTCESRTIWMVFSCILRQIFDIALFHYRQLIRCCWLFVFFTQNSDQNELSAAKQFLEQAAATNIAEFLKALSEVLANVSCSSVARTAAGLQLKNHLTSKDASITEQYHKQWLSFPENIREYIKTNVSWTSVRSFFLPYLVFVKPSLKPPCRCDDLTHFVCFDWIS